MKVYRNIYPLIISPENLFAAWEIFRHNKHNKPDVATFEHNVEENIFQLHRELFDKTYRHGPYKGFWVHDPKLRRIHKATVRDRVLHHAVFKVLNPIFDPTFISTSFSCRLGKGTHAGVRTLARMVRAESHNYRRSCWILKCDIRKFFDSIDHDVLLGLLEKKIIDPDAKWLLGEIVESFSTSATLFEHKGVPIGNLTSQIFANIYMDTFDQFVKHELKIKNYVRYTDDFVLVSWDKASLEKSLNLMRIFLRDVLRLELHPKKIILRKYSQGIEFLGYAILPYHIIPKTRTRQRVFRKVKLKVAAFRKGLASEISTQATLQSYLGVFSHANAHRLSEELKNQFWFWFSE